jgi:hypothetical protein
MSANDPAADIPTFLLSISRSGCPFLPSLHSRWGRRSFMVEKGDVVQARSTVIASVTPETSNRRTENLMDAR